MKIINEDKNLKVLTISEVAEMIRAKDNTATKKWLEQKCITIYKDTKKHYVYAIDIAVEVEKPWVRNLMKKYPDRWKDTYKKIAKDESVYELVLLSLSEESITTLPTTKINCLDNSDKKLLKKLTA